MYALRTGNSLKFATNSSFGFLHDLMVLQVVFETIAKVASVCVCVCAVLIS